MQKRNLIGLKINFLYIIEFNEEMEKYKCLCDCGNIHYIRKRDLIYNRIKSCGCLAKKTTIQRCTTHNKSHIRVYDIWCNMKRRCKDDPIKNKDYADYIGRGITVCERWDKFENFYEDMGDPGPKMELDRINNDLGYYKENCRWATRSQQMRNTRMVKLYNFNGELLHLKEISKIVNISYNALKQRISKLKLSLEDAINYKGVSNARTRDEKGRFVRNNKITKVS